MSDFIYDTVEKGRRRALGEMLGLAEAALAAEKADVDRIVRERVLTYFEASHADELRALIEGDLSVDILRRLYEGEEDADTGEVVGGIRSPRDAAELRGAAARLLESVPDHPGLLFVRAMAEVWCADPDMPTARENLRAGVRNARERYGVDEGELQGTVVWLLSQVRRRDRDSYQEMAAELLYQDDGLQLARAMLMHGATDDTMAYAPAVRLFGETARNVRSFVQDLRGAQNG